MQEVRFDDVAALQALVTEEFGDWGAATQITQAMIDQFADITGDRQWIHVDVEQARTRGPFGATIAHGFLTLGMATTVRRAGSFKIIGHGSAMNYGIDELRFLAPVPAGSFIHARTRVSAVEAKKNGTVVTLAVAMQVVAADKPALIFKWKLLYMP